MIFSHWNTHRETHTYTYFYFAKWNTLRANLLCIILHFQVYSYCFQLSATLTDFCVSSLPPTSLLKVSGWKLHKVIKSQFGIIYDYRLLLHEQNCSIYLKHSLYWAIINTLFICIGLLLRHYTGRSFLLHAATGFCEVRSNAILLALISLRHSVYYVFSEIKVHTYILHVVVKFKAWLSRLPWT